ncbi:MAG: tRNA (N6-threonylcarbamoyladenosine(37)-N6)-methyltransferase TrmO [Candidatus Bathyarchaeota archaeon]|nr:tRNA (N6-threonylcarbamoyladenosine(37)-N6)-methyltransferase TrmO [Candidatus Bathyarchaeota archaeon]
MVSNKFFSIKPIGYVRTNADDSEVRDKNRLSQIIIFKEYAEALKGLEGFSHIIVLFWLHKISSKEFRLKVHPRGRKDLPLLGVLATRTMFRPNPIGLTIVELVKVKQKMLIVRGLDAFNLTPVIDIKPYDFWDIKKQLTVPKWWENLEKRQKQA